MYKRIDLQRPMDYFTPLSERLECGVYITRLNQYDEEIQKFLIQYLKCARERGYVILGKLQNPDEKQLAYYQEIMGMTFNMDRGAIETALHKWLPRLDLRERESIANAMYETLEQMKRQGKNENILKNAYIKFMCWLYYRLEQIIRYLGQDQVPKLLYEGEISNYELWMLRIIATAGCDILILQYHGDAAYQRLDPKGEESQEMPVSHPGPFPEGFGIEQLQKKVQQQTELSRLYDINATKICSCNTWLSGELRKDSLMPRIERGEEDYYYNMFVRIRGVEDRSTYSQELFHWKMELEKQDRKVIILEGLQAPTQAEIAEVNLKQYDRPIQLLMDLSNKVRCEINRELEQQAKRAFVELIQEELENSGQNLNRTKGKAVYLVCWFQKYQKQLFDGYGKHLEQNTLFFFGNCKTPFEALFLRFLARMPIDIIVVVPDLSANCILEDPVLFEQKAQDSMKLEHFPRTLQDNAVGTVAFHAEQDLTDTLYQGTGLYRDQQYQKAKILPINTMYEEMYLLWDQEMKYRPNFEIMEDTVIRPVMFTKVSGVKNGNVAEYWQEIRKLVVDDTLVVRSLQELDRYLNVNAQIQTAFLKNRKLQRKEIKNHPQYAYGIYRPEVQEYILDKLQELIDSEWIRGTFSQGMEYRIMALVLNLDKEIVRMIQKMDLTKGTPKLLIAHTSEVGISIEGSILLAFLHLVGFDIAVFVPTGYQVMETFIEKQIWVEHQIGEYMYDLNVPDLQLPYRAQKAKEGILNKIFKRGR